MEGLGESGSTARRQRLHFIHQARPWLALILTLAVSACGEGSTSTDTVASIVIRGAPAEALIPGESVQLTATPKDAAGATVDKPVAWTSSNKAVAQVSAQGQVLAVSVGEAAISATSERANTTVMVRVSNPPQPEDTLASVLVSGVPAEPLATGESAQLTATPKDASGATLDRPVTWSSSSSEIAEVNAQGLVRAVSAGDASISATSGRHTTTVAVRVKALQVASVTLGGVPSGPVMTGTTVQLSAIPKDVHGTPLTDRVVTWSSSDTTRAQVSVSGLVTALKPGQVLITATSEAQSAYAALALQSPDIASVSVLADSPGLYVGQEVQLQAVLRNSSGSVVTGRTVTWKSSDASRAVVDANGKVLGVGVGAVTLTATCESASGTANLRVIARPSASWRQTAEWATFQGTARHTGAVEATLDPSAFRSLWSRQLGVGSGALNPVTEGDGRVFASSYSYFSTNQQLSALDARTGEPLWTYNFNRIHSAHPPAYSDGAVYLTTGGHEDSFLYAFDAATGEVRFRGAYGNQWSRYYAPVVMDGTVFMAGGYYGGMYAFNVSGGEHQWFTQTSQYDEWTPAVEGNQVFAYTEPRLQVVDALTGTMSYEIADPGFQWTGWSMNTAPVLGGAQNVLAIQGSRLLSFDLENRTVGWTRKASFTGTVTVAEGVLYVFNNRAVEARSEADGALLWTWIPPEGEPRWTTLVTDNLLFVSTSSNTYAVDLTARVQMWKYPAGGRLALGKDGILFIAQDNGTLAAIAVK
ncbi:Ig-like domain-containing protein [Corallococcus exiguus]|uniref:PQQ-binding-like beta-propeller repeat protein n=1 Tax=Corallococcus exiguus TaxID=83462 RepID=A0A7X5BUK3_9BACT|nr:Ig-like domain-containing protein [Corallococcus exiguus]NBC41297.1 PQQ-binding-like beta-propeller repeat protein [Corallococcus exiguus]